MCNHTKLVSSFRKVNVFLYCSLIFSSFTAAALGLPFAKPWTNKFKLSAGEQLGNQSTAGGIEDLLPLWGTQQSILFFDGGYKTSTGGKSLTALGSGARFLLPIWGRKEAIIGAFTFAEHQTLPQTQAWYINPGVEFFMKNHRMRAQLYYPLSNAQQPYANLTASNVPATIDNFNQTQQTISRTGHTLNEASGSLVNEYGRGFDIECHQYIPVLLHDWMSVGAYYFTFPSSAPIKGVEGSITLKTVHHKEDVFYIKLQDNYDNQKYNKVTLALVYQFGGYKDSKDDLSHLMESLISHDVSRPGEASLTPTYNVFVPSRETPSVYSDTNWYFSTAGTNQQGRITLDNCTFENPCDTLTQDIANGIQTLTPNASLYFETGTYHLPSNPNYGGINAVLLSSGQKIFGQTMGWSSRAMGADRPLINGSLFWGNNNDSNGQNAIGYIDSMQIVNSNVLIPSQISGLASGSSFAAIAVGATGSLTMNNNAITSSISTATPAQAVDAWTLNGALYSVGNTLNVSSQSANTASDDYYAYGLYSQNGTISSIRDQINATTAGNRAFAFGIFAADQAMNIQNSTIHATTQGENANAAGVYAAVSDISLINTNIQSMTTGIDSIARGAMIDNNSTHTLSVNGSNVSASAMNVGGGEAYGLWNEGLIQFILSQSTISATNTSGPSTNALFTLSPLDNTSTPQSICITNHVQGVCI